MTDNQMNNMVLQSREYLILEIKRAYSHKGRA